MRLFSRDNIYKLSEQIDGYIVEEMIGEGRFGICYRVRKEKQQYILKQLKSKMLKKAGLKVHFEEEILKNLQHDKIPRFINKVKLEGFNGYVLEFKQGKTFEDIIYSDGYVFERSEIFRIGSQLIGILKYLHSKNIVHRDIRVPNTLYDGKKINLIDFGLARWIDNKKYKEDIDFAFLGDFLLHLYYSSFEFKGGKKRPWYEELELSERELKLLKRLIGVEKRYEDILEVEFDFLNIYEDCV